MSLSNLPVTSTSTRTTVAALERTRVEQDKQQRLLNDGLAMAAYAADKGIPLAEMQSLIATNFAHNRPVLAQLETLVESDAFKTQQATERQAASAIVFTDISNTDEQAIDAEFCSASPSF